MARWLKPSVKLLWSSGSSVPYRLCPIDTVEALPDRFVVMLDDIACGVPVVARRLIEAFFGRNVNVASLFCVVGFAAVRTPLRL